MSVHYPNITLQLAHPGHSQRASVGLQGVLTYELFAIKCMGTRVDLARVPAKHFQTVLSYYSINPPPSKVNVAVRCCEIQKLGSQ